MSGIYTSSSSFEDILFHRKLTIEGWKLFWAQHFHPYWNEEMTRVSRDMDVKEMFFKVHVETELGGIEPMIVMLFQESDQRIRATKKEKKEGITHHTKNQLKALYYKIV